MTSSSDNIPDKLDNSVATVPAGVGDAVGVPDRKWFVAIVNHNTEKACAERIAKAGYECYLPTQEEVRVWKNGRRAKVVRVVIPTLLFIKCTERERLTIVTLPYIKRFMTNRAGSSADSTRKPMAVIPDRQIETLRFMLGNSDTPVSIIGEYRKGDRVKVIRGSLRGLEGEVVQTSDGKSQLTVGIDFLGYARVDIDALDVERIQNQP
jgi:transcription antitermination factor NusG